jgi:hypothetical protein
MEFAEPQVYPDSFSLGPNWRHSGGKPSRKQIGVGIGVVVVLAIIIGVIIWQVRKKASTAPAPSTAAPSTAAPSTAAPASASTAFSNNYWKGTSPGSSTAVQFLSVGPKDGNGLVTIQGKSLVDGVQTRVFKFLNETSRGFDMLDTTNPSAISTNFTWDNVNNTFTNSLSGTVFVTFRPATKAEYDNFVPPPASTSPPTVVPITAAI